MNNRKITIAHFLAEFVFISNNGRGCMLEKIQKKKEAIDQWIKIELTKTDERFFMTILFGTIAVVSA